MKIKTYSLQTYCTADLFAADLIVVGSDMHFLWSQYSGNWQTVEQEVDSVRCIQDEAEDNSSISCGLDRKLWNIHHLGLHLCSESSSLIFDVVYTLDLKSCLILGERKQTIIIDVQSKYNSSHRFKKKLSQNMFKSVYMKKLLWTLWPLKVSFCSVTRASPQNNLHVV